MHIFRAMPKSHTFIRWLMAEALKLEEAFGANDNVWSEDSLFGATMSIQLKGVQRVLPDEVPYVHRPVNV